MLDDTRFEIRRGIKNHERHSAILQAAYDTVNRMATVFGDLTFAELLDKPFEEWIPRIIPNVAVAAEYGLIEHAEEVEALFERIVTAHGSESFHTMAEYMSSDDARLSREIYSPVYKLWIYHGIRLPEFTRVPEKNEQVLKCIEGVLEHAGDFNYRTLLTTPTSKDLKTAFLAIRQAADNFIIYLPPGNGQCCTCSPPPCLCAAATSSDWCTMTGSQCTTGSTVCISNGPMR